jgi:ketosteroid isomerase-like protein
LDDLLETHHARLAALVAGDLTRLDELVGDDMIYISPTGKVQTKAEVFAGFRSGAMRIEQMEADEVRARHFDDIGIVTYRALTVMRDGAEVVRGNIRATSVYQNRADRWQLISQHQCRIAD